MRFTAPLISTTQGLRSDSRRLPIDAWPSVDDDFDDCEIYTGAEKVSDPNGAKHPKGRSGHRGQTPFPLWPSSSTEKVHPDDEVDSACTATTIYRHGVAVGGRHGSVACRR